MVPGGCEETLSAPKPATVITSPICDYYPGGKDNFAADRVAAEAMLKIYPDTGSSARANRAFLGRAVRYLAGEVKGKVQQQFQWRTNGEVERFFAGTDLVEPGLVRVDDWHQENGADGTSQSAMWAAVGRKT